MEKFISGTVKSGQEPLTTYAPEEVLKEFENVTNHLIQLLSSFNHEELNTVPFEGSWTAAQVGDHLLKSYRAVHVLNGNVKPTERPPYEKIEEIRTMFLNFDIKMNAPEFIIPSSSIIDEEQLLVSLKKRITQFKEVITTKDLAATCLDFAIPGSGEFTRLEWIYFNIYHTQRHNRQIKDISGRVAGARRSLPS